MNVLFFEMKLLACDNVGYLFKLARVVYDYVAAVTFKNLLSKMKVSENVMYKTHKGEISHQVTSFFRKGLFKSGI